MKKLLMLFMAIGLIAASCNNNKGKNDLGNKDREKDDYRNKDDEGNDDEKGGGWSAKDIRSFNSECKNEMEDKISEDQLQPFCDCLRERFESKYSTYAKFTDESTSEDGESAAKKCMASVGIKTSGEDDNSGGSWSRADEQSFMDECENTASAKVGATRANQYCECMLGKLKRAASSYAEANRMSASELQSMVNDCNRND